MKIKTNCILGLKSDVLEQVFRFLNNIHYGKETIPLEVPSAELTKEHKESYRKARVHRLLEFDLEPQTNGSYKILKINDVDIKDKGIVI